MSQVKASDFDGIGKLKQFNTLFNSNDGPVYGTITLILVDKNTVIALPDTYNFDIKNLSTSKTRNILTLIGNTVAGNGKGFKINFTGSKNVLP